MFNLQTSLLKHPERVKAVGKFSSYDYKKKNKKTKVWRSGNQPFLMVISQYRLRFINTHLPFLSLCCDLLIKLMYFPDTNYVKHNKHR